MVKILYSATEITGNQAGNFCSVYFQNVFAKTGPVTNQIERECFGTLKLDLRVLGYYPQRLVQNGSKVEAD